MNTSRFQVDQEPSSECTMDEFVQVNADDPIAPALLTLIQSLNVGGHVLLNLGAHGTTRVDRVS